MVSCGFKRQSYHGSSVVYRVRHILCCYPVSTNQACSLQNIFLKRKRNRHLYGTVATICNIYRVFLKHRSCFLLLIGMTSPDLKAAIEEKQHHLVSFFGVYSIRDDEHLLFLYYYQEMCYLLGAKSLTQELFLARTSINCDAIIFL